MYATNNTTQINTTHDIPIATLPAVERPFLLQNSGQSGNVGPPHNPLLPDRLWKQIAFS